jgi:hypothetical protein
MIAVLAVILGGDARAIRLARKLTHFTMWLSQIEVRRALRVADEMIDEESGISRAA